MLKNPKVRAATVSITSAVLLALIKVVFALTSGSMAVMASAVDSLLDIVMSGVNLLAIRHAEQPADDCHPFGHGKFETLATMFQALVIMGTGGWIVYEAGNRLYTGQQNLNVDQGIGILAFGTLAAWGISTYLKKAAVRTDSSALAADSLHFRMDIFSNLGLLFGMLLIRIFHLPWLDPTLSILVAAYILSEAFKLFRHALRDILDHELPDEIKTQVREVIIDQNLPLAGYHNLRTRRAGSRKIMDFHLEVCQHMSVKEAHDIADQLEKGIEDRILGADVTIHVEPCPEGHCPGIGICEQDKSRIVAAQKK
ncbi:cation diffusion facilitator family transporter [Geopsychrobacter electrodiphilus]|uniref:cation diffusion facilitator family transporter n=1 Tax=Geopsychrobacter electrodiphilus TaxID=225196 RepID=UPI00038121E4|nr:cation diffusion facilitator family transporter [Geopsychrobacter electrodiphilus]